MSTGWEKYRFLFSYWWPCQSSFYLREKSRISLKIDIYNPRTSHVDSLLILSDPRVFWCTCPRINVRESDAALEVYHWLHKLEKIWQLGQSASRKWCHHGKSWEKFVSINTGHSQWPQTCPGAGLRHLSLEPASCGLSSFPQIEPSAFRGRVPETLPKSNAESELSSLASTFQFAPLVCGASSSLQPNSK